MMWHFNYEWSQEAEPIIEESLGNCKQEHIPETTHNSPGSNKSCSFQLEDPEFSLEMACNKGIAESVWKASVKYLNMTVNKEINQSFGFNDRCLYKSFLDDEEGEKNLSQIIKRTRKIKAADRNLFLEEIKEHPEFGQLLNQLLQLFNGNIFQEIFYLFYVIWQKKYFGFKSHEKPQNFLPSFGNFRGFEDEEQFEENIKYSNKEYKDIVENSQEKIEDLARELFNEKKLKFLNLKEMKNGKQTNQIIQEQFVGFFKVLSQALFLSAQGFFQFEDQPTCEQEEGSICEFELEERQEQEFQSLSGFNGFIRSFSQFQGQDEEVVESHGSKKRKLF